MTYIIGDDVYEIAGTWNSGLLAGKACGGPHPQFLLTNGEDTRLLECRLVRALLARTQAFHVEEAVVTS